MPRFLDHVFRNPAFAQRDFRILTTDAVCYANGTGGEQVVFGLLVLQVSGTTWWVGVAFALYVAPFMLIGVPAGAIADWLPRRLLLRFIQMAIAVNLTVVGLLVGYGLIELWHILTMTFVSGCVRALYQPIRLSYAVDLVGVENAASGLAFVHIGNRIGQGLGALIAGGVMHHWGADTAYLALAVGHLIGFMLLGQLKTAGGVSSRERTSLTRTFVDYASEIVHNRALLGLVSIGAAANMFGFSFSSALPELTIGRLGGGPVELGFLHAARAVGGTLAMAAFTFWGAKYRLSRLYVLGLFGFALGLISLGFSSVFGAAVSALLIVAAMASLTDVLSQAMMQLCVADHLRGRAMGAWMISVGASPLGQLEMGALSAGFGVQSALVFNGVAVVGCAVVAMIMLPRLLRRQKAF